MVAHWPKIERVRKESAGIKLIQEIIIAIRNARSENKIEPAKKLSAVIYGQDATATIKEQQALILNLKTGLSKLEVKPSGEKIDQAIMIPVGEVAIYLLGAVDEQKEKERLIKEQKQLEKLINIQKQKLQNKNFVNLAPEKIVLAEKEKLNNYQTELIKIESIIKSL